MNVDEEEELEVKANSSKDLMQFQAVFDQNGATCCVVFRDAPRSQWKTKASRIASVGEAIELAQGLLELHEESGVFSEHPTHGGIFVWNSCAPTVLNGPMYFPAV